MEFTPNSCSSKCPRAPIYRLGVRMGVRKNMPGSRPDGQLYDKIFQNFRGEIFPV
jgi:hypothetical protein